MFSITRSTFFRKNGVLLHRSIYMGRPCFESEKAFQKFKLKQAKMQCDDNLPVYLKCGLRDKILYWITVGLTTYTTIQSFRGVKKLIEEH